MTYLAMSMALVGVAAIAAVLLRRYWSGSTLAVSGILLFVMTAIFDNLIIGTGIVAYDASKISGLMIWLAPIEDFSYTLAGLLILPGFWNWLRVKL